MHKRYSSSTFGYNDSKRCWYFGLRPCVIITDSGYMEDIVLSPGNCNDSTFLARYLDERIEHGPDVSGQDWIMDKAFVNNALAAWAKENLGLNLLARTDIGFFRQVQAKATAFSVARYFNQALGREPMNIAAYAV